MKDIFRVLAMICTLLCQPLPVLAGPDVTVFAAASLRDALEDVVAAYGGEVVVSYGGSGQIARQVVQGAPADIVILANAAWMDWLEINSSDAVHNRLNLLGNRLVLIAPAGAASLSQVTAENLLERLEGGRLAMGHRAGVPAGIYGRQWLENEELWRVLEPHVAETENVRAALALVARGETPLGLVYETDAAAEPDVVILYQIPGDQHDPITYPVARIGVKEKPQASELMKFIQSQDASEIFKAHGFVPLAENR